MFLLHVTVYIHIQEHTLITFLPKIIVTIIAVINNNNSNNSSCNWRASVASETLTGVTQSKIGDVYLLASERSERDSIRGG